MTILPPCPVCGHPAESADEREQRGVVTGNYLCAAGHIWATRWLVLEESA